MARQSMIRMLTDKVNCDDVSRKRDGTMHFMFRKGYFYGNSTPAKFQSHIERELNALNLEYTVIANGDHWAAFKGGASVAKSSHYWVEVKITE